MVAAIVQRTSGRQQMKGKHTVVAWQNLSKGKLQENIFYKYKRRQFQIAPVLQGLHIKVGKLVRYTKYTKGSLSQTTCVAGSPYQKDDSLYDDYDGDNAAGQQLLVTCCCNDNEKGTVCLSHLLSFN